MNLLADTKQETLIGYMSADAINLRYWKIARLVGLLQNGEQRKW